MGRVAEEHSSSQSSTRKRKAKVYPETRPEKLLRPKAPLPRVPLSQAPVIGCYLCPSNFRNVLGLNRHLRKYHGESITVLATHTCPHCKAGLSNQSNLERHIKAVHKDLMSPPASPLGASDSSDT